MIPDWIISDTHFNHENIIRYAGRPVEHNELMQQSWRKLVRPDETVLHLGDVLMGRRELWAGMPGWLPGVVSVLSSGNHDEPHKRAFMEFEWGWTFVTDFTVSYRGWDVLFSHYPHGTKIAVGAGDNVTVALVALLPPKTLNLHGHIHERPSPSSFHVNVCVEWMNYRPVRTRELLDRVIEELG